MALENGQSVTLTLTVNEKLPYQRIETRHSDEGYGSSSPKSALSTLPVSVTDETRRSASPTSGEGRRFRFRLGGAPDGTEPAKRLEKEKEAEDFIASLSERSLSIQRDILVKILNKEKRRIKFGLSSNKIMELAIRRYSYKFGPLIIQPL